MNYIGLYGDILGIGRMEHHNEENMEHEMERGIGFRGLGVRLGMALDQ